MKAATRERKQEKQNQQTIAVSLPQNQVSTGTGRLQSRLSAYSETRRIAGMRGVILDLFLSGLRKICGFRLLVGMTLEVENLSDAFKQMPEGISASLLQADEMHAWLDKPDLKLDIDFLTRAQAQNDTCLAMFADGDLAGYGWYSRKPTRFCEGLWLQFSPEWVYMYRGYTSPLQRGKRLHGHGMAEALRIYTGKRLHGLISYVEAHNFKSLRSVYRMGYRPIGRIATFRLFGRHWAFSSRGCRRYGLRLARSAEGGIIASG